MKTLLTCNLHLLALVSSLALSACTATETSTSSSNGGSSDGGSSDGTGSSEDGEALFAVSGDATADSIFGVWGSPTVHEGPAAMELRTRLSADQVEVASRCTFDGSDTVLVAGITANARISTSEITVLEAKKDERHKGEFSCTARSSVATQKACVEGESKANCFVLDGTTLTVYGSSPIQKSELTKISD